MIIVLVAASSRQKFDLVSDSYYRDEIAYQQVLDASRNQAGLSGQVKVSSDGNMVVLTFPAEFSGKVMQGNVQFYSPADKKWDRTFKLEVNNNTFSLPVSKLQRTNYTVKVTYYVDGKSYYYESHLAI